MDMFNPASSRFLLKLSEAKRTVEGDALSAWVIATRSVPRITIHVLRLADRLDSLASVKQSLLEFMKMQPGLRMIEPRFMSIEHAMATPKSRPAGAAYLKAFVEDMKASGFEADALRRSNQRDSVIALACAENVAR